MRTRMLLPYKQWQNKSYCQLALAYYRYGVLQPEDFPDLACQAMLDGCEGDTTILVAGMNNPTLRDLCLENGRDLREEVFDEMGLRELASESNAVLIVRHIIQLVEDDLLDAKTASAALWRMAKDVSWQSETEGKPPINEEMAAGYSVIGMKLYYFLEVDEWQPSDRHLIDGKEIRFGSAKEVFSRTLEDIGDLFDSYKITFK